MLSWVTLHRNAIFKNTLGTGVKSDGLGAYVCLPIFAVRINWQMPGLGCHAGGLCGKQGQFGDVPA
jgi:hypothetical protein